MLTELNRSEREVHALRAQVAELHMLLDTYVNLPRAGDPQTIDERDMREDLHLHALAVLNSTEKGEHAFAVARLNHLGFILRAAETLAANETIAAWAVLSDDNDLMSAIRQLKDRLSAYERFRAVTSNAVKEAML